MKLDIAVTVTRWSAWYSNGTHEARKKRIFAGAHQIGYIIEGRNKPLGGYHVDSFRFDDFWKTRSAREKLPFILAINSRGERYKSFDAALAVLTKSE